MLNMSTLVWLVVTTVEGRVPFASEVYILKLSHKLDMQSKMIERPVSDSIDALHPTTNTSRDIELELEAIQDGKIRGIPMDNVDSEPLDIRTEDTTERLVTNCKAETGEMDAALSREKLQVLQLKQELREAEARNT
ncbi:acyl-CoA-binding domain-containing protein 4-like [Iris pallida]|uniref:Acyl-CoA-binding domain-containing protein 4-like n=1 Tax=Iris pallida TaxID=29817 RepID=A0AAX6G681_IRIPA|nr:acyl-CoA-binding domain-containing protein 4-like [Iris pallida]